LAKRTKENTSKLIVEGIQNNSSPILVKKQHRKNLKENIPTVFNELKAKHETKEHNSKLIVEGISKSPLAEFINRPHHDMTFKEYQELSQPADERTFLRSIIFELKSQP